MFLFNHFVIMVNTLMGQYLQGQCRIIKCLALEAAEEEEAPVLLKEDEMLTAEFLQVDNQSAPKRSGLHSTLSTSRSSCKLVDKSNNDEIYQVCAIACRPILF